MNFFTVSLNFVQHDTSIAVFNHDELIFFHQGERFTRKKHDNSMDLKVVEYILNNITSNIDILTIGPHTKENIHIVEFVTKKFKVKKLVLTHNPPHECQKLNDKHQVENFTHHSSHALSAFYMSPFEDAVCLVMDAVGSDFTYPNEDWFRINKVKDIEGIRGHETTSIFEISKNYKLNRLYQRSQFLPVILVNTKTDGIIPISHIGAGAFRVFNISPPDRFKDHKFKFDASVHIDIGCMYQTISWHLNFGIDGCGKVMGLSAYGKEDSSIPKFLMDDTIYSNNNLFLLGRELNHLLYPELYELSFQKKANLAYAMQKSLEKVWLHHIQFIKEKSKIRNLIIGGGCALNILGVSLIKEKFPEFNIFVDPIAHDATHAIGEGIHYYNLLKADCKLEKRNNFKSIYLGPKYDEAEMSKEINQYITKCDNL